MNVIIKWIIKHFLLLFHHMNQSKVMKVDLKMCLINQMATIWVYGCDKTEKLDDGRVLPSPAHKVHLKGMLLSKYLTCMNVSCINKMTILSWRRIHLAKLLCVQFIHLTKITLRPNKQLLGTCGSMLISRFWITSWFYSVYNICDTLGEL